MGSTATFSWGLPTSATQQALTITNEASQFVVYGYDTGDTLANSTPAPARRVHLGFLGNSNYDNLTDAGFALLDAAIAWAANTSLPALAQPVLASPVIRTNGQLEVNWTGVGILENAPAVGGPYTPTPWPLSPYTETPGAAQKYFRVRQ